MVTPNGDMYTGPRQRPTGAPVVNMPRPQSPMGMLGQGISQFAGGVGGGLLDVGRRMLSPGTSPFTGQNLQPYDPMFQPQSLPGQIGRGFVSGFTGGYPEGPVDHEKLSGLEQAFYFGDLVDPSGIAGDILRPLSKAIPEGTLGALAGVIPKLNRTFFRRSKVVDDKGGLKPLFHGTRSDIKNINPEYARDTGLYGPGFYMTDSPDVAGGYSGWTQDIQRNIDEMVEADKRIEQNMLQDISTLEGELESLKGPDPKRWLPEENRWEPIDDWDIPFLEKELEEVTSRLEEFRRYNKEVVGPNFPFGAYPQLEGANVNAYYADFKNPFDIDAPVDKKLLASTLDIRNFNADTMGDLVFAVRRIIDKNKELLKANEKYRSLLLRLNPAPARIGSGKGAVRITPVELRDIASQVVKTNDDLWDLMLYTKKEPPYLGPTRNRKKNIMMGSARDLTPSRQVYRDLMNEGYDSITHVGGARSGGKPHQVWIDIDSEMGRTIPASTQPEDIKEIITPPRGEFIEMLENISMVGK